MDRTGQQLLESYEKLLSIQQLQLSLASKEKYDEQISDIRELERQKLAPQALINEIRLEESFYNEIVASRQTEITDYIRELQSLNEQLQKILSGWYGEASSEMQQVSVHRKTLQTYGGVNYSDVISYFIDDKK
ncbi:hypothetical protein ACX1C1_05140 [Paenibacillus sp. strain BS8-2]